MIKPLKKLFKDIIGLSSLELRIEYLDTMAAATATENSALKAKLKSKEGEYNTLSLELEEQLRLTNQVYLKYNRLRSRISQAMDNTVLRPDVTDNKG